MKEKLRLQDSSSRNRIKKLLKEGKIGLFPTDTIYGICCRMDSKSSVERIYSIKQREENKPFLILASSVSQVADYANLDSENFPEVIKKYWPGPLTVILKAYKDKVLSQVRAGGDTIAVRIPDYPELSEIISEIDVPLVAPSANISGEIAPGEYSQVDKKIVDAVDFVVIGECKMKKPSTIVDCSGEKTRIVREGAIDIKI